MQSEKHLNERIGEEKNPVTESGFPLHVDRADDRLARIVDEIRAEAQVAPAAYLNDAIVPKGGE